MGKIKTKKKGRSSAGSRTSFKVGPPGYMDDVHRPVTCLVFLLPLVIFYEVGLFLTSSNIAGVQNDRVIAFQLLQQFLGLFGATGYYLPGLAGVAILVAWQVASGDRWVVKGRTLWIMTLESLFWAVPLVVLVRVENVFARAMAAVSEGVLPNTWFGDFLLSVGAGIYEELLFRLILITVLTIVFMDIMGISEGPAIFMIMIISAVLFSLYHYLGEPFQLNSFVFRAFAGGYLAGIFILRGFGITVGCHVMYDLLAVIINAMIKSS